MKRNERGFTLIELLVAAAIIAILSVIGVVSYNSLNKRSRDAKRKSDIEQVRSALEMYRTDEGSYPTSYGAFTQLSTLNADLVDTEYLPAIPYDPKSTETTVIEYFYSTVGDSPYYGYCLCGNLETLESEQNECSVLGVTIPIECNYGKRHP